MNIASNDKLVRYGGTLCFAYNLYEVYATLENKINIVLISFNLPMPSSNAKFTFQLTNHLF